MRKSIAVAAAILAFLTALVVGSTANRRWAERQKITAELQSLSDERNALSNRLVSTEAELQDYRQTTARLQKELADRERTPSSEIVEATRIAPQITTNANGKKTYLFPELFGAGGQVIAREARFRELMSSTKFAFRTQEGVRYYDLDDLHPEVVRALGYDAAVLKRRAVEDVQRTQLLALQAQYEQELRAKAALEQAERDKAQSERLKAEAAMREAEAKERLAAAAERAASNPPAPPRIIQKVIVIPHSAPEKPKPLSE